MLRDGACRARQVAVNCNAWNPRQSFAGENQRPSVALFARHARVNKNVLELARPDARDPDPVAPLDPEVWG